MLIIRASGFATFIAIYLVFAGSPVQAAGFACEKASTLLEHLICAVPALSALDSTLAKTYESTMKRLSADVASQMRLSQRSWLKYLATVCGRAKPDGSAATAECMEQHYRTRIGQLEHFEKVGPFVFTYISLYAVQPFDPDQIGDVGPPQNMSENNVDIDLVTYPQIAQPSSRAETAANGKLAEPAPGFDPDKPCYGQSITDEKVTYATLRMVSVRKDYGESCTGAAHPDGSISSINWLLNPELRELRADDLFGPHDTWAPKLSALTAQSERSDIDSQGALHRTKQEFLDDLKRSWSFTDFGLELVGTSDDFGCHVGCGAHYRVSWAELKPLLVATAPVP